MIRQLQPLVLPQPSQTWQEPAGRIFVPQVKHIGASDSRPCKVSISSADEWTSTGAGVAVAAPAEFLVFRIGRREGVVEVTETP